MRKNQNAQIIVNGQKVWSGSWLKVMWEIRNMVADSKHAGEIRIILDEPTKD